MKCASSQLIVRAWMGRNPDTPAFTPLTNRRSPGGRVTVRISNIPGLKSQHRPINLTKRNVRRQFTDIVPEYSVSVSRHS